VSFDVPGLSFDVPNVSFDLSNVSFDVFDVIFDLLRSNVTSGASNEGSRKAVNALEMASGAQFCPPKAFGA
jgi:hypothetical protein